MTERRVVRAVSVPSVARVAFALSLCVWAIAFVGFVALYILGLVSGGLGGVEGFIASLGFTGFRLTILPFLGAFVLVGGIASAITGVVAGLLAHLYNSLYPLVGGIEVAAEERRPRRQTPVAPQPPPQPPPPQQPPPPAAQPYPSPAPRPDVTGGFPRPGE